MLQQTTSEAAGDHAPVADTPAPVRYKGIAICGSNPITKMGAPFQDPEWLIYACSPDNSPFGMGAHKGALPRVDQFFEVHAPLEDPSRPAAYLHWVTTLPLVWMRDARALQSGVFKGARPYPEQRLFGSWTKLPDGSAVPTGDGEFWPQGFSSSIAYILAKTIIDCQEQGIPSIALYGILQAEQEEYRSQRPGTQYMLWEARRRGIKTLVAPESRLLDACGNKW